MNLKGLDDKSLIQQVDVSGMLGKISSLPAHLKEAFNAGISSANPINNIKSVVFFGLGGSAIAGEIICQKLSGQCHLPALVIKKSNLPAFVNGSTLCITLSYSGNTKETLDCYREAIKKKAVVVAITSGGELEKLSVQNKNILVKLPPNYQPRAALGFLVGGTLGCLTKANLINDLADIVEKTTGSLNSLKNKYAPAVQTSRNPAKKIALELLERLPLIYASESLGLATANRWKNQLNENAKVMAFSNVFPELAHNEIMSSNKAVSPIIIYLKNPDEKADQLIANSIALKLMKQQDVKVLEIASEGESQLEKMLSVILLGDFVSAYLAIIRQVDPTPIENINLLKKELEQKVSLKTEIIDIVEQE